MTSFDVEWTRQALRDLQGLDATIQMRVMLRVEQSRRDPLRFYSRLKGDRAMRMRIGDWRVIADVRLAERKIVVLAVGHRAHIYRG